MTGVVFLDKPKGLTSFVAANRVKRILNAKKSGHWKRIAAAEQVFFS